MVMLRLVYQYSLIRQALIFLAFLRQWRLTRYILLLQDLGLHLLNEWKSINYLLFLFVRQLPPYSLYYISSLDLGGRIPEALSFV